MKKVLVTGGNGFIAKNLIAHLSRKGIYEILTTDRSTSEAEWSSLISQSEAVVHLAGENRPKDPEDFKKGNSSLTSNIVRELEKKGGYYKLIYASSTQAILDNPYGKSKLEGEKAIVDNLKNGSAIIFRFPGVFGKWCKPAYNSVVATYCFNIANNLPIEVRDEAHLLKLMYIDDVVSTIESSLEAIISVGEIRMPELQPLYEISLGQLADTLKKFKENRSTYYLPNVGEMLEKKLYSTYLTYLNKDDFGYAPVLRTDERGSLFELLKSTSSGQIFMSTTKPGITRGNHFHHTKTEKFCVVAGTGLIQFRKIDSHEVIEYKVCGTDPKIVDIPPGYTHNIKNIGEDEMVTLFWANEIFDANQPDTYFEKV